jgi:hypothetical protein
MTPRTPADFGGPLYEDEVSFYDQYGLYPTDEGCMVYSDGYFYMYDQYGIFNPRQGGTGLNRLSHESLDTLVHSISETSYDEITRDSSGKVTNITTYTDYNKTLKVREEQITFSGRRPTELITIQYDSEEDEEYTLTEVYEYSGNEIINITRTKT